MKIVISQNFSFELDFYEFLIRYWINLLQTTCILKISIGPFFVPGDSPFSLFVSVYMAINSHRNNKIYPIDEIVTMSFHMIYYTHKNMFLLNDNLNGTCEHQKPSMIKEPTFRLNQPCQSDSCRWISLCVENRNSA